jgi:hypothetical protein
MNIPMPIVTLSHSQSHMHFLGHGESVPSRIVMSLLVMVALNSCHHAAEPPAPPVGPDTTSHNIVWTTVGMGDFSSVLLNVWGTSPTSVWAVGIINPTLPISPSFVVHYDGNSWREIRDDSLSWWIGAGALTAVHGISDSSLFVAGNSHGDSIYAFVGRWDGRAWHNISPSRKPPLHAIWARSSNDLYVGGRGGTILHFNGQQWIQLQSPTQLEIQQIFGLPTGEIFAVACDQFNSTTGGIILRLDGLVPRQYGFVPGRQLLGFWGDPQSRYAVGEFVYRESAGGGAWEAVETPNPQATLFAVSGSKGSDILIAGAYGAILHWNGVSWKFFTQLYDPMSVKTYFGALSRGGEYFLVGYNGTNALLSIGQQMKP